MQRLKEEEARAKKEAAEKAALEAAMKEEEPIATAVIDQFTDTMLEGQTSDCLKRDVP